MGGAQQGRGMGSYLGKKPFPPLPRWPPAFAVTHFCPFSLLQHSRPSRAQTVRTQPVMMPTAAGRGMAAAETLARGSIKNKGKVGYSSLVPLLCSDRT